MPKRMVSIVAFALGAPLGVAGCGPTAPRVLLEAPKDFPDEWQGRRLFHTPQGYIFARSPAAAGEADRWVGEVKSYIRGRFQRDLDKGLVVVMEPADEPIVRTLEDELILERDRSIMPTRPRRPKPVSELRQRMAKEGVPEGPTVQGATIPLPRTKLDALGLDVPPVAWAVAAPSDELAEHCGLEVGAAALRKKRPDWSDEQARKAAAMFKGTFAKAFEITRGDPVFVLWAQRQTDWSDDQRREAINKRIRNTCTSNWLPAPKDEDLEW